MDRLTKAITSHRRAVIAVFLALALICAVLMLGVSVNYKLADYLPPDAESTVALGILNDEFGSGIPNTRVMVSGLTLAEAEALKSDIAAVDGVTGVMWLDDVEDLSTPVELMDQVTVEQYWRDGSALYQVTVADGRESSTIDALYELIGENGAIAATPTNTANITKRGGWTDACWRRGHRRAHHRAAADTHHHLLGGAAALPGQHRRGHPHQHGHQHRVR